MRKPRVEDESLRLAEGIDDDMQEGGVEAHGAGGIEHDDEPQRLDLAAPPGEVDRRSAVRHIAMNGAAQVEPSPTPAHLLATDEPRAHDAGKTFGERLGLRDVIGIDDVANVDGGEIFKARGAFAFPAAIAGAVTVAVPFAMTRKARRSHRGTGLRETPRPHATFRRRARLRPGLTKTTTQPEGVEDFVEALPVRMGRAEERPQCRLQ